MAKRKRKTTYSDSEFQVLTDEAEKLSLSQK